MRRSSMRSLSAISPCCGPQRGQVRTSVSVRCMREPKRRRAAPFSILHFDEARLGELVQQDQEILFATGGVYFVLSAHQVPQGGHTGWLLQDLPNARAHRIEAVIHSVIDLKDGGVAVERARDLAATGDDVRCEGNHLRHQISVEIQSLIAVTRSPPFPPLPAFTTCSVFL